MSSIYLWLFLFLFSISPLHSKTFPLSTTSYNAMDFHLRRALDVALEHAITEEELAWGLMQRDSLPANHGMVFHYDGCQRIRLWMFNCFMNLSAAFLDEEGKILEIRALYAHPCKMDPRRPVYRLEDMAQYSPQEPIIRFFNARSVVSTWPSTYALEMPPQWFQENGVRVGDVVDWDEEPGTGWVMLTMDVSCTFPTEEQPVLLYVSPATAVSLRLSNDATGRDIAFLDDGHQIQKIGYLKPGKGLSLNAKPVFFSEGPCSYVLITLPGWLKRQGMQIGDEIKVKIPLAKRIFPPCP